VLRDLIGNKARRTDGMGVSFGQLLDQWLAECERLELSPSGSGLARNLARDLANEKFFARPRNEQNAC
jgi:hypothetical protein